jgi:hypothetical protein
MGHHIKWNGGTYKNWSKKVSNLDWRGADVNTHTVYKYTNEGRVEAILWVQAGELISIGEL